MHDHYADLGELIENSWFLGREHILPVHGPTGITQIVEDYTSAYQLERSYRTTRHGEAIIPPKWSASEAVEFAQPVDNSPIIVYEKDGVVVKTFRVSHPPVHPAVGYRIEYNKVIVISGDSTLISSLRKNCQDANLLVCEVMNKEIVHIMEKTNKEIGNARTEKLLLDIHRLS